MNKPDTWMPLYVDDYLGAARELSCAESGAYLHLLLAAWTRGGELPDDDAKLRRMAGATPREWPKIKAAIVGFFSIEHGVWRQERLRRELLIASERYEKLTAHQRDRATHGWQKIKKKQGNGSADGTPGTRQGHAQSQPQESNSKEEASRARTSRRDSSKSRSQKTALPHEFGISDRVREWAASKGYSQLEAHLEAFKGKCRANGYSYIDWDDAFMNAIREDWAGLRGPRRGRTNGKTDERAATIAELTGAHRRADEGCSIDGTVERVE